MVETENITRFRRCRKMLLKDLVKFSIIILGGFTIFSILFWWSLGFEYFTYTWIIGTILLGPIDLVWYIVILFNCSHLVSSTRQG
jgi:hypothetical protein